MNFAIIGATGNVGRKTIEVLEKSKIKNARGRKVRVSGFKKAIVTIKKGQNIDLTLGI